MKLSPQQALTLFRALQELSFHTALKERERVLMWILYDYALLGSIAEASALDVPSPPLPREKR